MLVGRGVVLKLETGKRNVAKCACQAIVQVMCTGDLPLTPAHHEDPVLRTKGHKAREP